MTRLQLAWLALAVGGALALAAAVRPLPAPPAVSVMDWAELLGSRERSAIADYRDRLRRDHDIDYRLVTTRAAGDANWASHEAFAALRVGERSLGGRGVLLVVDAGADRVRLEVAAALEDVFTDAFVADLEQRRMAPYFRTGRVADAILAATEAIVARAEATSTGAAPEPGATPFGPDGEASPAAGPDTDRPDQASARLADR
jgi:uncharacterized membrane protein YgcG